MREIFRSQLPRRERYILADNGILIAWVEKLPQMNRWWMLRSGFLYWVDPGARDVSAIVKNNFGLPWFLEGYEEDSKTLLIKGKKRALAYLEDVKNQGKLF